MKSHPMYLDRVTWAVGLSAFCGGAAIGYAISKFRSQPTAAVAAAQHLSKLVEYSLSATIIHVADRLNLFEHLYEMGPCTTQQLATKLGWSERWLREVLLQLTASGICLYQQQQQQQPNQQPTFVLKPEYAALLRGPNQEANSIAGVFQFLSALVSREDAVVQAVQTGLGIDYDFGKEGKDIGAALDRKNGNFFRNKLCDELNKIHLPQTGERLVQKLEQGIAVADIGCGFGTSTIIMAQKFPNSHFYAFESSPKALQAIEANIKAANVSNVTICKVPDRTLGDGPDLNDPSSVFHFVYAHDVMHDMVNPRELIKDVKKRLSKHGCWFIVDIECSNKVEDNLRLPHAAMLYAFSCLLCLSMATSEPHGEGLGTCGFSPELAKRWMKKAGFHHFEKRNIPSLPYNACYLVA